MQHCNSTACMPAVWYNDRYNISDDETKRILLEESNGEDLYELNSSI